MEGRERLTAVFTLVVIFSRGQLTKGNFSAHCNSSLGMEDGGITNRSIVASTRSFGNNPERFGPQQARLRWSLGYRADPVEVKETSFHFLMVKLPQEVVITGIATQGLGKEWVTKYELLSRQRETGFVRFREVNGTVKKFEGNTDGDKIKHNSVPIPKKASEVLFVPTEWHGNIALRFELYGCSKPQFECEMPLGMENGEISDADIETETNSLDANSGPEKARLRSPTGYRADPEALNRTLLNYIKVKLPKETIITGIATQGLGKEWVKKFELLADKDQSELISFKDVVNGTTLKKKFKGNTDGDSIVFNSVPFPLKTAEVYIHPTDWHKNIALRFEIYGCEPHYYFTVWLEVLGTKFSLRYMDRDDVDTKNMEIELLNQVEQNLQNVAGFISVELDRFSLPLSDESIGRIRDKSVGMIAEVNIYCVEYSKAKILKQLKESLTKQGNISALVGKTLPQVLFRTVKYNEQCRVLSVNVSLNKDPRNPTVVTFTNKKPCRFLATAHINSECREIKDLLYSWEVARVDKMLGMFEGAYLSSPMSEQQNSFNVPLGQSGLHYVRCLVRRRSQGIHIITYDFGFIETVAVRPLQCNITPTKGTALLETFSLNCSGGYENVGAVAYTVKFNSSRGPLVINLRTPDDTIRLPAGDRLHDYTFRLNVEAHFSALQSLHSYVFAKVIIPTREDIFSTAGTLGVLKNKDSYSMSFLNAEIEDWGLDKLSKTKIRCALILGSMKTEIDSPRNLKQEADCIVNSMKDETTNEIQDMSLHLIEKAVKFLDELAAENISEVSNIASTLLKGAALILDKASEATRSSPLSKNDTRRQDTETAKNMTKRAVMSIRRICEIKSSLLRESSSEATIRMEVPGISVSLAKINTSRSETQVLRLDKILVPKEIYTGKWKSALHGGSLQVIRFAKNPYSWNQSIIKRNLSVVDVILWSNNGSKVNVYDLKVPIRITFSRDPKENTDESAPENFLFLKKNEMRFHIVTIPSYEASITVRIRPNKNITLQVYIKKESMPTTKQYDLVKRLPCSSKECSSRDPYEFELGPNDTGYVGDYFIGIEIKEDYYETKGMSAVKNESNRNTVGINNGKIFGAQELLCVKVKPPPPTQIRKFNAKTDVRYTFYAAVRSCVFWHEEKESWSTKGCQIASESNETAAVCLANHLTTFSGNFYVIPNNIDFNKVFKDLPPDNLAVLLTVCITFAIYTVGLIIARRADNRDKMKIINIIASSYGDEEENGYNYEVSIQTGMWHLNGTTARVGIRLFGEEGSSDKIFFMDPWQNAKLFTRGSVNTFTLTLPAHMGKLYKIQIWHDNSGKSPSWFLHQVVIRDNSTNEKWHFVANRWLSVEKLDGAVDVEVWAATNRQMQSFTRLFHRLAVTNFADKHLFLSLFTRPPQNSFTRCQRLTCLFSIIMISLVTNAMFYRLEKSRNSDDLSKSFQIGPLEISLRQIVIGVQCGLIALPVSIGTVFIFRNIKKTIPSDNFNKATRKGSQGFLPPCFVVIGWMICLTTSISSGTFTVFYSIQWGAEVSNRWLLSVGITVLQDILINGPIFIVINTAIASLFKIKQTGTTSEVEISRRGNLVFHGSGDVNIRQPSDKELQKMRHLRLHQRKMHRFFIELGIYIAFIVLLMTVCYGNRKPSRYRLTKSLKDTFSNFSKVEDPKLFWKWFENELVPGLYDARLYSGHSAAYFDDGLPRSKIGYTVGMPRLRQIRIKQESTCELFRIEPLFRSYFNRCLADVSGSNKDTTPSYKPWWKPMDSTDDKNSKEFRSFCPEPWQYTVPESASELLIPYGAGGYIAKIGYDNETALRVKQSLEEFNWMDDRSAVILAECLIFEPANLLLTNVMFVLERFSTGLTKKTVVVVPVHIFPSSDSALWLFYHICILLWSVFTIVLVVLEIVKVFKQGCSYFKAFFNWVSSFQLLSSVTAILLVFLKENDLRDFLQKIKENPFGYWTSYELVKWETIENVVLSITVVLTTVKSLKLIKINRHIYIMKSTLEAAWSYICSFFFIVILLALAFANLGTLLFGTIDEEYSTLYFSVRSVFQMAIGIGKMRSKLSSGPSSQMFVPLYRMSCMLALSIVFTDTFIAILDEAYHRASHGRKPGEDLGDFIKNRLKNGLKRCGRKSKKFFVTSIRKNFSKSGTAKDQFSGSNTDITKHFETHPLLCFGSLNQEDGFPNQTVQGRNRDGHDGGCKQETRVMLAETESLFSGDDLTDNDANDQRVHEGSGFEGHYSIKEPRYKFPSTEEDLLLSDVKEAMEYAKSVLGKYVWKNECDARSLSSISSKDDKSENWNYSLSSSLLFGVNRKVWN